MFQNSGKGFQDLFGRRLLRAGNDVAILRIVTTKFRENATQTMHQQHKSYLKICTTPHFSAPQAKKPLYLEHSSSGNCSLMYIQLNAT